MLLGDAAAQKQHSYLYWMFYEKGGSVGPRFGKWKGVRVTAMMRPNGPIEVYDLENDLAETTNLADTHPEIVARFKEVFQSARTPSSIFTGIR